jgi:hypothetical protein
MRNIFLIYIPSANSEALIHYEDTIKKKVLSERIYPFINPELRDTLRNIFDNKPIAVWGSRNTRANKSKFARMNRGDDILIVEGDNIKLLGKIAEKTINPDLSKELWKNLKGKETEGWDLIYFIANPLEINLSFKQLNTLFNYQTHYTLHGLTAISESKLKEFYARYDDLYSILQRIKNGDKIEQKNEEELETGKIEPPSEDLGLPDEKLSNGELSEHLKIQWKLILLGRKAGTKVWVPKNDQTKIFREYKFSDFEKEFEAGIDIQAKYVENIDVVWKEEFRIDAAFEIEHSTSIYSGLLRFSDLKIIAPNSNYPLILVAPSAKRNRIIEQICRPTFKKLEFQKKVRFLTYEAIYEIDNFFESSSTGLNVDLIVGKSEVLQC